MRDWLIDELDAGATIVTASRRLARALTAEHAEAQVEAGATAWATPSIQNLPTWLAGLLEQGEIDGGNRAPPVRLNTAQSRVLWESFLARELGPDQTELGNIVRAAADAWSLVHTFGIPLSRVAECAENRDQGVFARAAERYAAHLATNDWIDDALLAGRVAARVRDGSAELSGRLVFAGFDRITPALRDILNLAREQELVVSLPPTGDPGPIRVAAAADLAAELRAAGFWARECARENPGDRIAIIVTGLEREPATVGRLVQEGFVPGWQAAGQDAAGLVNVSLGTSLDSYPLVGVALLVIRWLHGALTSRQLGVLLRCNFLGVSSNDARARLEQRLREIAGRDWTPARVIRVFASDNPEPDVADFLARVERFDTLAKSPRGRAMPGTWARHFDAALEELGWPGRNLSSPEQQLLNRWRDLLNELSHLELVTGPTTAAAAADLVRGMARDTVFQPEDTHSIVSVLGPLEAAGLEFDAVRITGLNAELWPAAGRATPLLSRSLAREYGLPDATPEDSLAFAKTVLGRIAASAPNVSGSYALAEGDSELAPTRLVPVEISDDRLDDPGWYAASYLSISQPEDIHADPVPPVSADEKIRGGASTLDAQIREPFAAFAGGRLAVAALDAFADGLTPRMRGTLIHDALCKLYAEAPRQAEIRAWPPDERAARIAEACRRAVMRHRIAAGATLERLLDFEEMRVRELLDTVIDVDLDRPPFRVLSVEGKSSGRIAGLELSLRHDRIDETPDGSLVILDYKTGLPKKFLERGAPRDYQLIVYAATLDARVSGLGLYNVDSRDVAIDGIGITADGAEEFELSLAEWLGEVEAGARLFCRGDVRVNQRQSAEDARSYGLLSRFAELVRRV